MKKLLTIFCVLLFSSVFPQKSKNYIFNVELSDRLEAPSFISNNGLLEYNGKNNYESEFFSKYSISYFSQSYPDSNRERTLNMFTFITSDKELMNDLLTKFSEKYLRIEDLTDIKVELTNTYPNDYGITSPTVNLGINMSLKNFDYVNVPKAWDYTTGNQNIIIGISDAKIDNSDIDFSSKTTFLEGYFNAGYDTLQFIPPPYGINSWHGTGSASTAAAQGNNANSSTGICMDCSIVANAYGFGPPGTDFEQTPNLNYLLQLAYNGARVINMSWSYISTNPNAYDSMQWVIDEIYDLGVVLVASAGNDNSYNYPPHYLVYGFPASLNHVISVSGVNHKNKNLTDEQTGPIPIYGMVSWYNEDLISPTGALNYNGNLYTSFYASHTTNERVDICAPSHCLDAYLGFNTVLNNGSGSSGAAPHVTGTVGLMLTLNNCLTPDEVEDILQLSSKNIEANPYNSYFIGRIGAGKLETGDAVEFVYEMMNENGNAVIDGQDFYRFNFDLQQINNKLTISNQQFRDANTSNFVAKNEIDLLNDVDFKPNGLGFVDLKIDNGIDITCPSLNRVVNSKTNSNKIVKKETLTKLYPNPNDGKFTILLSKELDNVLIEVFDIYGKIIYEGRSETNTINLDLPNLNSGLYLVRISNNNSSETLKFIKK